MLRGLGARLVTRRTFVLGSISLSAVTAAGGRNSSQSDSPILGMVEGTEELAAASDACVCGYPLVTTAMARRTITKVAAPEGTQRV
jgi:hypothetical protein